MGRRDDNALGPEAELLFSGQESNTPCRRLDRWRKFEEEGATSWTLITFWGLPGEKTSMRLSLGWKSPLKDSGPIFSGEQSEAQK